MAQANDTPEPDHPRQAAPRRSRAVRALRWGALALVLGAGVAALLAFAGYRMFVGPGPAAAETVVLYPRGTGLAAIAADLDAKGLIANARVFKVGVLLAGRQDELKAGEYAIPPGASMQRIMEILVEGKSILHKLTVAEGLTSRMIVDLVNAHDVLAGDPVTEPPPEGTLLPETYLFLRGTTRAQLVERMRAGKAELLDRLWAARKPDLPLASKEEALILASIVEKETGVAEERPRVAAVFVNRLRLGMRLQSDPTIIYGITQGAPLGRGIRRSELEAATPYNTYLIDGLPPTPIANPGRAALEAVLNPPDTDDLYFVADGSGGHAFAATLDEHNRNVARWRQIERERAAAGQ